MPWKVVSKLWNRHNFTCPYQGKFFKVAEYSYHKVFTLRKVVLKLRNTHITTCSCRGKCLKVA